MPEPRHAGGFLRQIVREASSARAHGVFAVALDRLLKPSQRPHCHVLGFRDGKLTLEVDSAPLFAELSAFAREDLRLGINQVLAEREPDRRVARLQFRLGGTGHV